MATATKKSPAYDKGYREGKADKAKKPAPMMESPEGEEEESPEEEEEMDAAKGRKRDGGYMKTPMDATCSCGAKGRKSKKCSCGAGKKDGMCGSRKMDSLTAPEYLDACELGINRRSNAYIRARLDAEQRLDLKCGKGAISKGEKCTKGAATTVQPEVAAAAGAAAQINNKGGLINVSNYGKNKKQNEPWATLAKGALIGGGIAAIGYGLSRGRVRGRITVTPSRSASTTSSTTGVMLRTQKIMAEVQRNPLHKQKTPSGRIPLSTPTLSQLGELSKDKKKFNAFMSRREAPLTARAPRRPSTIRRRDEIYAAGFTADTAALNL